MRIKGIYCALIVLLFASCGSKFEQLESGYEFRSIEKQNDQTPEDGDAIRVHMTLNLEDSIVTDTREFAPIGRRLAMNSMRPEFKEVMRMMGKGDSVQVRMNLYAYSRLEGRQGKPEDSAKLITMSMRILDVKNESSMIEDMVQRQLAYEEQAIKDYLVNNNLDAERTEEGIYYIISQEGIGDQVALGDTVVSNFTLKLLDNTVLTTTEEAIAKEAGIYRENNAYEPYTFTLAEERLLEGWLIGVPLLRKEGKGSFIMPSRYAFGSKSAAGVIPPNATLIYEIEVLEIR